jgi:hypothetical protein
MPKEVIEAYFASDALNQSSIKTILKKGMQYYLANRDKQVEDDDLYYEEKTHFVIGKAVDVKTTGTDEDFERDFYLTNLLKKPGATAMSILRLAFDMVSQETETPLPIGYYQEHIHTACNREEYYMNRAKLDYREDKRVFEIISKGEEYWKELVDSRGKQILTEQEYECVKTVVFYFMNHPHTAHLFQEREGIDIVYQFPIYWVYEGVQCKGLIDMLIIDHNRKMLLPIDIKTIGDYVMNFYKAVETRRYDIQACYYTHGLWANRLQLCEITKQNVMGYKIGNFAFLVESTTAPGTPTIFPLSDTLIKNAAEGDPVRDMVGWQEIVREYARWQAHDFSLNKLLEDCKGVVYIGSDYRNLLNFQI